MCDLEMGLGAQRSLDGRLLEYLYRSRDKETALIEAISMIEKCIYVQPHAGVFHSA